MLNLSFFTWFKQIGNRSNNSHKGPKKTALCLEMLEDRQLLSVTTADYDAIREQYSSFSLPAEMSQVNVIELTDLTADALQAAINNAAETTQDDLIVVRTSGEFNTIALGNSPLTVDFDTKSSGTLNIASYGESRLTLYGINEILNVESGDLFLNGISFIAPQSGNTLSSPRELMHTAADANVMTNKVYFFLEEGTLDESGLTVKASGNDNANSTYSVEIPLGGSEWGFLSGVSMNNGNSNSGNDSSAIGPYSGTSTYYIGGRSYSQLEDIFKDAEKREDSSHKGGTGDSQLCWAATTANMLAYTGWGHTTNEDTLLQYFNTYFGNYGGHPYYGLEWYFTGNYTAQGKNGWSQNVAVNGSYGGRYYDQDTFNNNCGYSPARNYSGNGLMRDIDSKLRSDISVGLGIGWLNGNGHAVTVWGFKYDSFYFQTNTSYYKSIIVSDSDDNKGLSTPATAPNKLVSHDLYWSSDYGTYLYYSSIYGKITDFTWLKKKANIKLFTPTLHTPTVSGTTVSVSWTSVPNRASYTLEYKQSTATYWSTKSIPSYSTSTTFTGVAGKTYNVRVKAIGSGNCNDSNYSNTESITIPEQPLPDDDSYEPNDTFSTAYNLGTFSNRTLSSLKIVTNNDDWFKFTLGATGTVNDKITMTYTHVSGSVGLGIVVSDSGGNYVIGYGSNTGTENISLSGLSAGIYYLRIYNYDTNNSVPYALVFKKGDSPSKLSRPTLYTPTASGTTVSVSWSSVSNCDSYTLEYKQSTATYWSSQSISWSSTSATFTGVAGKTYDVRVKAEGSGNYTDSDYSPTKSITVPPPIDDYSTTDCNSIRSFLEQTDSYGVKNGTKLNSAYSSSDPSTWSGVTWTSINETKRATEIHWIDDIGITGNLNLSGCTLLKGLFCGSINLSSLNITGCTELERLMIGSCGLTSLDVSKNVALFRFLCYDNNLATLDVSKNIALKWLWCYDNNLTSLDLSKNSALEWLMCYDNNITTLDVSYNTHLTMLYCWNAGLRTVKLPSSSINQTKIVLSMGSDTTWTFKNSSGTVLGTDTHSLNDFTVSQLPFTATNEAGTQTITFTNSATPSKLSTPTLNTPTVSGTTVSVSWSSVSNCDSYTLEYKQSTASSWSTQSISWSSTSTTFTGVAGKTYNVRVKAEGSGNYTDSDYSTTKSFTVPPPTDGYSTTDCNSIRSFLEQTDSYGEKNGTKLNSDYSSSDPSTWGGVTWTSINGTKLATKIAWGSSGITGNLNLSGCTLLDRLYCGGNNLRSLNITGCTEMTYLSCGNSGLTSLDVSKNIKLTELSCGSSSLTSLDISKNTELLELECERTNLSSLDVTKNTKLTVLDCAKNNLTTLDVSKNVALEWLFCCINNLETLDLSKNTRLEVLWCWNAGLRTVKLPSSSINQTKIDLSYTSNTTWTFKNSSGTVLGTDTHSLNDFTVSQLPFTATNEAGTQTITFTNSTTPSKLSTPTLYTPTVSGTTVSVSWSSVSNCDSYTLEYKQSSETNWSTQSISRSSTSATFTGVAGKTYNIRVKAEGSGSYTDSNYSSTTSISIPNDSNWVVTSTSDSATQAGTLRYALANAPAGTTITFASNLKGRTITLNGTELLIQKEITIDATSLWNSTNCTPGITINANQKSRVFNVHDDSTYNHVFLKGLKITGGLLSDDGPISSCSGGGINCTGAKLTLINCTVTGNSSGFGGGGIYVNSSGMLALVDCMVSENVSDLAGGIWSKDSILTLTNCLVSKNCADTEYESGQVGGIYSSYSSLSLTNCTITGNTADIGGGGICVEKGTMSLYNSIVALNIQQGDIIYDISNSSFFDTEISVYNTITSYTEWDSGSNNLNYDPTKPLFVNSANGNYRLAQNSQAINKGNNTYASNAGLTSSSTDLAGNARIVNNTIDIGAYEYQNTSSSVLFDVDGDGKVLTRNDAALIYRYIFNGKTYRELVKNLNGVECSRANGQAVANRIEELKQYSQFDVDGDGRILTRNDATLIYRYIFNGKTYRELVKNLSGVTCSRANGQLVAGRIEAIKSSVQGSGLPVASLTPEDPQLKEENPNYSFCEAAEPVLMSSLPDANESLIVDEVEYLPLLITNSQRTLFTETTDNKTNSSHQKLDNLFELEEAFDEVDSIIIDDLTSNSGFVPTTLIASDTVQKKGQKSYHSLIDTQFDDWEEEFMLNRIRSICK